MPAGTLLQALARHIQGPVLWPVLDPVLDPVLVHAGTLLLVHAGTLLLVHARYPILWPHTGHPGYTTAPSPALRYG